MSTSGPFKSSNPTKKNVDCSSQKRVTQFFTPSSKAQKVPINIEDDDTITSPVPRKRVKKRIIPDSPVKVIDIDSLSSEDDELVFSPPRKAKAVKRPLPQMTSIPWRTNTEDNSQKKTGLVMRNSQQPATSSFRPVLEEKKNFNMEKTKRQNSADSDVIVEDGEDHRNGNVKKIKYQKSSQEDSIKTSKQIQSSATNNNKIFDSSSKNQVSSKIQNRVSFGKEKDTSKIKKSKSERTQDLFKDLFASTSSEESNLNLEEKQFKKRSEVLPVFKPKLEVPSKSSLEKGKRVETTVVDIDEQSRPLLKTLKKPKILIRRSTLNSEQKDKLSIGSSIVVGLDEIGAGAAVAFRQTYKDIPTLLDMKLDVRDCPNYQRCVKNTRRRPLSNSFHVNFEFYMKKDNQMGALDSVCPFDLHRYPDPADLHSILYKILMKAKDQLVLQNGQEQIYEILGSHPPCDPTMKNYYRSVISYRFDDPDPCSRWENLRYLLKKVLDEEQAHLMCVDPDLPPSKLECRRAVLGFIIQILSEDLYCWIQETKDPLTQLRDRVNLPLIAQILWSQSTIPHITVACRELIRFHVDALKSRSPCKLSYTKPLVKMMAIVTQLSDLQLPLKVRKPSFHMYNLAREIVSTYYADNNVIEDHLVLFYHSLGSPELSLLLPLTVLNRRKPLISIPHGEQLNLTWLLNSYLELDSAGGSKEDVIARFWTRPSVERKAFLTGLITYFKLYCAFKTWFHMRNKYSSRIVTHPGQYFINQQPLSVLMFSRTFTPNHLMEDLRLTKYLLEVNKTSSTKNSRSMYSLLSWSP